MFQKELIVVIIATFVVKSLADSKEDLNELEALVKESQARAYPKLNDLLRDAVTKPHLEVEAANKTIDTECKSLLYDVSLLEEVIRKLFHNDPTPCTNKIREAIADLPKKHMEDIVQCENRTDRAINQIFEARNDVSKVPDVIEKYEKELEDCQYKSAVDKSICLTKLKTKIQDAKKTLPDTIDEVVLNAKHAVNELFEEVEQCIVMENYRFLEKGKRIVDDNIKSCMVK